MPDDQLQMLAEEFVLGSLAKPEADAFARRLTGGEPAALKAFEEARRLVLALPYALPQQAPPPELKQNILRAIASEENNRASNERNRPAATVRAMPQRTFRQSAQRALAWAAVFLLFAVGYGYWNQQKVIGNLLRERASLQQQVGDLQNQLAFHVQIEKVLQKPKRLFIALNPTPIGQQQATGVAIVDRELARGYFMTDKMPALAENQDYQLWYIGKAGPIDAGVFKVDAEGYGVFDIRNLPQDASEISAFAVTIEPKGGSIAPTLTQMVLLGKA